MNKKQEQRDEILRKIRELEREQAEIDLQNKTLNDWDTKREDQLQEKIEYLRFKLDNLSIN
jgi:hypothetical protein